MYIFWSHYLYAVVSSRSDMDARSVGRELKYVTKAPESVVRYEMIRVMLVDDQSDFRQITRFILSLQPDIKVVGEAGDGAEALEVVEQVHPNVVLMDVQMPILDGIEATKQIRAVYPHINIILFTAFDHDTYVIDGIQAGALGYLRKNVRKEVLVSAIRAASQGLWLDTGDDASASR